MAATYSAVPLREPSVAIPLPTNVEMSEVHNRRVEKKEAQDVDILDTDEQKKVVEDLRQASAQSNRLFQWALSFFGVAGSVIFVTLALAQLYYPASLELHLQLEDKAGATLLFVMQALSAFSYILSGYYIYSRDSVFRWIAGASACVCALSWIGVLVFHEVTEVQYLCIPAFNLGFFILCWYAERDSAYMLGQVDQLESYRYEFKKL